MVRGGLCSGLCHRFIAASKPRWAYKTGWIFKLQTKGFTGYLHTVSQQERGEASLWTSWKLPVFAQRSVLPLAAFQGAELALLSGAFVLSRAVFSGSPGINTAGRCARLLTLTFREGIVDTDIPKTLRHGTGVLSNGERHCHCSYWRT